MAAEYHSLKELTELAESQNKAVWEIVQQADMEESERTAEQSFQKMLEMYRAMKQADRDYDGERRSASKRAGGDGEKLHQYNEAGKTSVDRSLEKSWKKQLKWENLTPVCGVSLQHRRQAPAAFFQLFY